MSGRDEALVDADWLESHLDDDDLVVVEVDEDTTAYERGHVRGAVTLHWVDDLQDPVRRDLVDADAFGRLVGGRGIGRDTTVVLYGGNNNWFAAYAYWMFALYGHRRDRLRLLDGGRKKWELDGRELVDEVPDVTAVTYEASEPDPALRAFRDDVVAAIGSGGLVDVRSPAEFSGEILAPAHLPQEAAQRPGHVPTAVNVPWSKAAEEDGTFKDDDVLERLYRDAGLDADQPVIAYCRIGERSAHTWFVLHELLGRADVKNYDGSWSEYGSLVGVPVELGAGDRS